MPQHLLYGTNILASDLAPQLEEYDRNLQGVNTWRNLFGNASLQNMAAQDTLKTDYASAAAEAYKAYQKQKNSALAARLTPGATADIAAQANRDFINSAYSQYVSKYLQDANKLTEDYADTVTGISDSLTERAENYASLYRSAYDYLSSELAGARKTTDGVTSKWMADNGFADFLTDNGEMRTWNDISRKLFDENKNLTLLGKRYYDVILNSIPDEYMTDAGNAARSFDEWLAATNPDLRDWYVSADAFGKGSAASGVKSAIGVGDRPYSAREYADFTDYIAAANEVFDLNNKGSTSSIAKALNSLSEMEKDYNDFVVDDEALKLLPDKDRNYKHKYQIPGYGDALKTATDEKNSLGKKYSDAITTYRNYVKQYYDDIANQLTSADYESFVKANATLVKDIESVLNKENSSAKDLKDLTRNMRTLYTKLGEFSSANVGTGAKAKMETTPSLDWTFESNAETAAREEQERKHDYNEAVKKAADTRGSRRRSDDIFTTLFKEIFGNG